MIKNFFLKSGFLRSLYCYIRFIYFFYLLKRYSFFYEDKLEKLNSLDPNLLGYDGSENIDTKTYLSRMQAYEKQSLIDAASIKNFKFLFSGDRTSLLINPLMSCRFIDKKNAKVLSVGPRTEGEIYNLICKGFSLKNITAIDLQTYSPLIKLGDIHNLELPDDYFDIIICGWTIAYSYNRAKAASELIRVAKNNSLLSISGTYKEKEKISITIEELSGLFKDNIKKILFNLDHKDFSDGDKRKHVILTASLKKS